MNRKSAAVLAAVLVCASLAGCAVRNRQMRDTMPVESAAQAASWEAATPEDSEKYILPLGGLAWHDWKSPAELHDVSLFIFCMNRGYEAGVDYEAYNKGDVYEIPAALFDDYVSKFFKDENKVLHAYSAYSAGKDAYVSTFGFGGAELLTGKVEQKREGDALMLRYEIVSPETTRELLGNGLLEIRLTADGFYYVSNSVVKVEG